MNVATIIGVRGREAMKNEETHKELLLVLTEHMEKQAQVLEEIYDMVYTIHSNMNRGYHIEAEEDLDF